MRSSSLRHGIAISGAVALTQLVLQALPLSWYRPFAVDWVNHVWLVQYYSDYLKQHAQFPTSIDVVSAIGNPLPIFYGVFFYPLIAVLGIITGADVAIRIVCATLLAVPLISFGVLFRSMTRDTTLSILLSTAVTSSVYQLTNLYQRSALTEFVAVQLLILSISLVFYGLTRKSRLGDAALALGFAFGALSLGAHPITFYTVSIFGGLLLCLVFFAIRSTIVTTQLRRAAFWLGCAVLVLSPWVVNTVRYQGDLLITTAANVQVFYFPTSIDSWWGRLGLFYVDLRVLADGIDATSTPFLDAPFTPGLLLVLLVILGRLAVSDRVALWRLVVPSTLVLLAIIWVTLPPRGTPPGIYPGSVYATAANGLLYKLLLPVQFIYRLAGTFTLCMIVLLVLAVGAMRRTGRPMAYGALVLAGAYAGAIIGVIGVGQKLYVTYVEYQKYPAYRAQNPPLSPSRGTDGFVMMSADRYQTMVRDVTTYPPTFYGASVYTMPSLFPAETAASTRDRQRIDIRIAEWGRPTRVTCAEMCVLRTNVVPSTFLRISVDGAAARNVMVSSDGHLQFSAEAGTHTVQAYKVGRLMQLVSASVWVMLLWFMCSTVVFLTLVSQRISARNHARTARST